MRPPGEDERWKTFGDFHEYLAARFPLVCACSHRLFVCVMIKYYRHSKLQVTKVNTYALTFHWQGSNESLKPILLMGHMGTLPYIVI